MCRSSLAGLLDPHPETQNIREPNLSAWEVLAREPEVPPWLDLTHMSGLDIPSRADAAY